MRQLNSNTETRAARGAEGRDKQSKGHSCQTAVPLPKKQIGRQKGTCTGEHDKLGCEPTLASREQGHGDLEALISGI